MSLLTFGTVTMAESENSDLDTVTVRIRRDLARMLKTICANTTRSGKSLKAVDYLEELLRERIEQDYTDVLARLSEGEKAKRGGKKK
jgi:hypothetical protein